MSRFNFSRLSPVVAGIQTLTLVVILLITLIGSVVTQEFESRVLLPELLLYLVFIAGLSWVTRGLWLSRSWAQAPMIAVQLIVIGISYEDFWQSDPLFWKFFAVGLTLVAIVAIASTLKIVDPRK